MMLFFENEHSQIVCESHTDEIGQIRTRPNNLQMAEVFQQPMIQLYDL